MGHAIDKRKTFSQKWELKILIINNKKKPLIWNLNDWLTNHSFKNYHFNGIWSNKDFFHVLWLNLTINIGIHHPAYYYYCKMYLLNGCCDAFPLQNKHLEWVRTSSRVVLEETMSFLVMTTSIQVIINKLRMLYSTRIEWYCMYNCIFIWF